MKDLRGKNYNLNFLYYFNIEKGHYIKPPTNACNLFLLLSKTTTGVLPLMLELVVTAAGNSIFTSGLRDELELCCYSTISPNPPDIQVGISNISTSIPFSISNFSGFLSKIFQDPPSILNILPSVLHKNAGRRY